MIFTLGRILDSLAGVLQGRYPDYPVYYSPNQQGTEYPCFFIFFMPSEIKSQPGSRYMRDLGVDIVFVQQRNIVDGNTELLRIAGCLDEAWSYSRMHVMESRLCSGHMNASGRMTTENFTINFI